MSEDRIKQIVIQLTSEKDGCEGCEQFDKEFCDCIQREDAIKELIEISKRRTRW